MHLYLARHGECSSTSLEPSLSEQGKKDIQKLSSLLKPLNIQIENIFHSGKLRAKQTAELLQQNILCSHEITEKQGLNPNDDVVYWAEQLIHFKHDILLVGHLPFMSKLVSQLITNNEQPEVVHFHPGTFVCLEHFGDARWAIDFVIHPSLIQS